MIFVTGDVHHMGMGGADQTWLRNNTNLSEIDCAVKYAEIASKYEIPVTVFLTGRSVEEETDKVLGLFNNSYVEVGGHTWNALQPPWRHFLKERFKGSYYGGYNYQERDIERTTRVLSIVGNSFPDVWRTHAYRGDSTTYEILKKMGYKVVSDEVGPVGRVRRIKNGLFSLPINVPPDHEHLFHGNYSSDWWEDEKSLRRSVLNILKVKKSSRNLRRFFKQVVKALSGINTPDKAFGDQYLESESWLDWIKGEMEQRLESSGFATFLLHPACMEILDGMDTLEYLFQELQKHETAFVSQAPEFYHDKKS